MTIDPRFKASSKRSALLLTLLSCATIWLGGCRDAPSAGALRFEIERQLPGVELERESHIRLGRFTMGLAKKIARLADDEDDEDLRVISHIKRVDVATYRVVSRPAGPLELPADFEARLARKGWETTLRAREDGEQTWVLFRSDPKGAIRSLYVVAFDSHELSVIQVEGRLDRLIAQALADDPGELDQILGT